MKNLLKVLVLTMVMVSLMGFAVFADDDMTVKERIGQLKEEGYTRTEIAEILKEEGIEMKSSLTSIASKEFRSNIREANKETRVALQDVIKSLKEEGITGDALKENLIAQGYDLSQFNLPKLNEEAQAFMAELKEEGLSREEIREKLIEAGFIEKKAALTDAQKAQLEEIRNQIKAWREEGFTREETFNKLKEAGLIDENTVFTALKVKGDRTKVDQVEE